MCTPLLDKSMDPIALLLDMLPANALISFTPAMQQTALTYMHAQGRRTDGSLFSI